MSYDKAVMTLKSFEIEENRNLEYYNQLSMLLPYLIDHDEINRINEKHNTFLQILNVDKQTIEKLNKLKPEQINKSNPEFKLSEKSISEVDKELLKIKDMYQVLNEIYAVKISQLIEYLSSDNFTNNNISKSELAALLGRLRENYTVIEQIVRMLEMNINSMSLSTNSARHLLTVTIPSIKNNILLNSMSGFHLDTRKASKR